MRTATDLERKYNLGHKFSELQDVLRIATSAKETADNAMAAVGSMDDHTKDNNNPHKVTASQVGARPDTWLPSLSEIGAAPAGYGLGLDTASIATIATPEQLDNATQAGWYQYYGTNLCGGGTNYGGVLVIPSMFSTTQMMFPRMWYGSVLKRINTNGNGWESWEWVNPPLIAGQEYRTIERFNGKPVFIKMVDCEGMPSGTNATRNPEHFSENVDSIVSYGGYMSTNDKKPIALPYYFDANNQAHLSVSFNKIYIVTGGTDLKSYTEAKVWFKYTKSTY